MQEYPALLDLTKTVHIFKLTSMRFQKSPFHRLLTNVTQFCKNTRSVKKVEQTVFFWSV